jgi:hypothetical protein
LGPTGKSNNPTLRPPEFHKRRQALCQFIIRNNRPLPAATANWGEAPIRSVKPMDFD